MKAVYYLAYILAFIFIVGETSRRGFDYLSINTTTMVEDYLGGTFLLWAALSWHKAQDISPKLMVAAWAYLTGGMLVPFFAHSEAWLRGETFRPDHPHTDIESIVIKGVIWAVCLSCLIISLRSDKSKRSTV